MKTTSIKRIAQSLGATALVALGSSVFAASTWDFTNGCGAINNSYNNASLSCLSTTAPNPGAVTVTAWSVTGTTGATFAAASVGYYNPNGFGVTYTGEATGNPQHTVDNSGQTDLLLLNFGSYSVDLDSVKIGYKSDASGSTTSTTADADISVFRYNGANPPPLLSTETMVTLGAAGGWELVGNYADLSTTAAKAVNTTNKTSSWWIISAYNSSYGTANVADQGAPNSGGTTGLQNGNDYFKVLSVAGTATKLIPGTSVTEPGSIALLGLGLIGLVASRRRGEKAA